VKKMNSMQKSERRTTVSKSRWVLALIGGLALSNPSYAITAKAHVQRFCCEVNNNPPPTPDVVTELPDIATITFQESVLDDRYLRRAEASARGSFGTFSAYAFVELQANPRPGDDVGAFGRGNGALAEASLFAGDLLRVSSASLPRGTPVTLNFDLNVIGTGQVHSIFEGFVISHTGASAGGFRLQYDVSFGGTVSSRPTHLTLGATVGSLIQIEYSLQATAATFFFGLTNGVNFARSAVSDYANTAHFFAQSSTPGAFLLASSGHDYAQPAMVPLPMSGALLLPALTLIRRRRAAT
jgi:hypothetical protein